MNVSTERSRALKKVFQDDSHAANNALRLVPAFSSDSTQRAQLVRAFAAFNTLFLKDQEQMPPPLSALDRQLLIEFAERNIAKRMSLSAKNETDAIGRLRAIYVAGAMATLDDEVCPNPFRHFELVNAYDAQRRFLRNVCLPHRGVA